MFGSFEKVLSCLSDLCKKNQKKILMYDDFIAVFRCVDIFGPKVSSVCKMCQLSINDL